MEEMIKRLHRAKLVPALISIAFGIALIIARQSAMDVAIKIGAVMLMACGAGALAMYLFGPIKDGAQLMTGGFLALLGVLAWVFSRDLVDLFPIITGIGLILNGLSNLSTLSVPQRYAGKGIVTLFSILMVACGILILVRPGAVADALLIYVGISYIINGVFDVVILYRVKEFLLPPKNNEMQ